MAGIAAAILGLMQDRVRREMTSRLALASEIDRLTLDPRNEDCTRAEQKRRQELDQQLKKTFEVAETYNRRTPLLEGVFPVPARPELIYKFQEAYRDALYKLPREMKANGRPTEQEVRDEREIIEEAWRDARTDHDGGFADWTRQQRGDWPADPTTRLRPTSRQPVPPFIGRPDSGPTPVPEEQVRFRAAIKKARSIRMYATMDLQNPSFYVSPVFDAERPTPKEMWYAQVGLWVQQDVARAIEALNSEAAKGLNEKDVNVTRLPVKRLVSTQVYGYVTSTGQVVRFDSRAGGPGGGPGAESVPPSFTGRKSDEQFDVIRFSVTAIVDQRDLLQLIDYLSRANFYQLVGARCVSSDELHEADEKAGYFYGEDPVAQATLEFEGYLARKVYKPLMPADALTELGIKSEPAPQ
jgi:hypothetical protein